MKKPYILTVLGMILTALITTPITTTWLSNWCFADSVTSEPYSGVGCLYLVPMQVIFFAILLLPLIIWFIALAFYAHNNKPKIKQILIVGFSALLTYFVTVLLGFVIISLK